jgi:hypothetical protein
MARSIYIPQDFILCDVIDVMAIFLWDSFVMPSIFSFMLIIDASSHFDIAMLAEYIHPSETRRRANRSRNRKE